MSLTAVNWPLIIALIAIVAVGMYRRSKASSGEADFAFRKAGRDDIETRPQRNEDGRRLPFSGSRLVVPAVVFLIVASIGAASVYLAEPRPAADAAGSRPLTLSEHDQGDALLASLADYTQSIGGGEPASVASSSDMLPDVSTMIGRLEARLKSAPGDLNGWRMLGWSYFNTGHYAQASAAYAKALEIDPGSAELKLAYDEANAKASAGDGQGMASSPQAQAAASGEGGARAEETNNLSAMPAHEQETAIRSMVDGLADRLENSPRDVEGWARLMRSRIVLGERDLAATAMRKALDVFKDDSVASRRITSAAIELGLKAE